MFPCCRRAGFVWTLGGCIVLTALGAVRAEEASSIERRLQDHLSAGEFGPARALADTAIRPAQRDAWLGEIARAQLASGARRGSFETTFDIEDDVLRSDTFGQLAAHPDGGRGAAGGAALADFDSLIELITSTVAPETWDVVGGPGAIEEFATGVYVNREGVLKRLAEIRFDGDLTELRRASFSGRSFESARRESALRKVSLTRLERNAEMLWAMGREPDEAMQYLAGLYRLEYVFFYPETRDIVVAGPAGDWIRDETGRPVHAESGAPLLRLDDLVVLLRNVLQGSGRFGCSITPTQENLASVQQFLSRRRAPTPAGRERWMRELRERLGYQEISVHGLDPRTHAARILVEADYHMKLIGMGLEEGTVGVESYLETVELGADGRPPEMDVLRWWFTTNYESLRASDARDAFQLAGPGVKVLSENEMLGEGGARIHTGDSTELNQGFAHRFTSRFDDLAAQYPVYAELRNIFDMALLAALMRSEDLTGRVGWELPHFGTDGAYEVRLGTAPHSVQSVINHRTLGRRHWIVGVSGGVSVDTRSLAAVRSLQPDTYGLLAPNRSQAAPREVPLRQWWWD